MSATRDPSQKFTFVYSNLYQLYRKGKDAAQAAVVPVAQSASDLERAGVVAGKIIKAENLNSAGPIGLHVRPHQPPSLLTPRIGKPLRANQINPLSPERAQAIHGLRENLKNLKGLHERLRFMLKELESLTKDES